MRLPTGCSVCMRAISAASTAPRPPSVHFRNVTEILGSEGHLRAVCRSVAVLAVVLSAVILAAGCSSSGGASGSSGSGRSVGRTSRSTGVHGSGQVNVLYAGSLVDLMEKQIKPGFDGSTGYSFTGFSGGSTDLAAQIKGKVHQGDVFVSASPQADSLLTGSSNGNWVSWFGTFATAPLVLGYNPKSRFAADLRSKPWYEVVTEPGFRLGSTDPATDPKGELAVEALKTAARSHHDPALGALAKSRSGVYPEETLVGRLQSGQLDAGFFYSAEATAAHIPTVKLTGVRLAATYTVTVLDRAPHQAGGEAFVKYLLGPHGRAVLQKDGFRVVHPAKLTGSGVPSGLHGAVTG